MPLDHSLGRAVARHRRLLAAGLTAGAVAVGLGALAPDPPPGARVVVAARDLGGGQVLTAADLAVAQLPAAAVPDGATRTADGLLGRTLAGAARRGEPITDVRLVGPGLLGTSTGGTEGPDDLVAAPVRLADAATTALVGVGDVVDVLAADSSGTARVVAPAARVLAVPQPPRDDLAPLSGEGALLVLAVPAGTAADLAAAATRGPLSITMR